MLNVEKIIRVLGYIVYTALWSPVIILALIALPIIWLVVSVRAGKSIKESLATYKVALRGSIQHDIEFIKTGVWY